MIRSITVHISSQHSDPTQVAWTVREKAWTPQVTRETVMMAGTLSTPMGGAPGVLRAVVDTISDLMDGLFTVDEHEGQHRSAE